MQSAKDLSYKESLNLQFSKKGLDQVSSYFFSKGFAKVEINYFAPYFGYANSSDGFSVDKRKHYEEFSKGVSLEGEARLKLFYDEFVKQFKRDSKYLSFSLYEPKVYSDIVLGSINRMFLHMNERIESKEQEGVLIIYLIDQKFSKSLSFEEHLPFVNYITFTI